MLRLDRTLSTVRAATTVTSTRPAYAAGIRAAVATVLPLAIATLLGHPDAGTWLSLGGFNAALSDRGGSYRNRAVVMAAVMTGTAIAILLGSLAGHRIWLAVPLTFVVAFVASLARVWGAPGVSIGSASLSTFVIALAFPSSSIEEAVARAGLALVGGSWAMLLALLLWPLRPYRPARVAVAASFDALADFIQDVASAMGRASPASRPEVPVGSAVVRGALEEARLVLAQLRRGRPGSTPRGEQLLVLGDLVDQLFGHVVAVTESIETIPPRDRDPAAQLLVLETLSMIAASVRALAIAIEVERDAPPIPLGWTGDALRALVTAQTPPGEGPSVPTIHYLHAASILDRTALFAETAAITAGALSETPVVVTPTTTSAGVIATSAALAPVEEPSDDPSPWAVIRAILTPDSVILLYALRVAVVVSLAVLLVHLLDVKRGYWMTITVIVIMQPYTGATTHRALQRVLGTVLGGILTAALGAYFHDPRAILVLSFFFAVACVALMPVNYAAFSAFLTPTWVLLAEASAGDWQLAGVRVINTLLGGALALAGARLLWPSPESTRLPGYMAAALRANAAYLRLVAELFADRSHAAGERMRAARRRIGLATANAEESFQRWIGEHSGPPETIAPAMAFMTYTRRFTASVASLALARHTSPGTHAATLAPFATAAGMVMEELADALTDERPPAPLPMLGALEAAEHPVPPLLHARVDRLARQLRMMHEAVGRLTHSPLRREPAVSAARREEPAEAD
jgi:uncharacterized membrane protein YccC